MSKLLLILLLSIFPAVCFAQQEPAKDVSPLNIVIESDKPAYKVGEQIVFAVRWVNAGSQPLRVQYQEIGEGFNFIITDQSGKLIAPFRTVMYDYVTTERNFPVIEPLKIFSFKVSGEVVGPGYYAKMHNPEVGTEGLCGIELGGAGRVLEPGKYNVQYLYNCSNDRIDNGRLNIKDIFTGKVISNTLKLEIQK